MIFFILLFYFTKFSYSKLKLTNEKTKKLLSIIRTVVWGLMIIIFINPLIQYYFIKTEKSKIAVLIDNSLSMMIKDKDDATRFNRAKDLLKHKVFNSLNNRFDLQYFLFDSALKPSDPDTIEKSPSPDGGSTDIGNALLRISSTPGRNLQSIILLSDGINNVYHNMDRTADKLNKNKIKVFTFQQDENENIKDISLMQIDHPMEINVNTRFYLRVKVNSIQYQNTTLPIQILLNDKPYGNTSINVKNGINILSPSMTLKKIGVNKVTLKAIPLPGESILLNNSKSIFIRAIKNKFKVLLIYGQPSFEYKFLKLALETDPNIITDAFFKLGKSLTGIDDVMKYDLIIVGNIKYRDIPMALTDKIVYYANNKNGSLLFLGGRYGFRNGDYHNSKFKDIIPVTWNTTGEFLKADFTIKLTPNGLNSTATHLIDDVNELQKYWDNLPPCNLVNTIKKVKKGTDVLAVHSKYPEMIVLAVGKIKRCRVGIFSAYPSWKWGFINIGMGYSENPFNIFWQQFVRYLINMNLDKVNLTTNKLIYKKNEDIFVTSSLFDKNFKPVKRSKIQVEILKKEAGKYNYKSGFDLYPGAATDGYYESIINRKEAGEYKLKLNSPPFNAETLFLIQKPEEELYQLRSNNQLLKFLSKSTDGEFMKAGQIDRISKYIESKNIKRKIHQEIDLWPNWFLLLSVLSVLTTEWYIRKKNGLA